MLLTVRAHGRDAGRDTNYRPMMYAKWLVMATGELSLLVVAGVDVVHQLCKAVHCRSGLSEGCQGAVLGDARPGYAGPSRQMRAPRRSSPGSQT